MERTTAATPSLDPNGRGVNGSRLTRSNLIGERLLGTAASRKATLQVTASRTLSRVRGANRAAEPATASLTVAMKDLQSVDDQSWGMEPAARRREERMSRQEDTEMRRRA